MDKATLQRFEQLSVLIDRQTTINTNILDILKELQAKLDGVSKSYDEHLLEHAMSRLYNVAEEKP